MSRRKQQRHSARHRAVWFGLIGFAASVAFADEPPRQVLSLDLGATAISRLRNGPTFIDHQSNTSSLFSYIQRRPLVGPLYWNAGLFGELYTFSNSRNFPVHQLQGYAAQFSIEYFQEAKLAAYIKIRPGFYFENRPVLSAWDVPVEAVTGVPIVHSLHGVLGVSNGRFYHHAVPIVGLSWDATDRLTLNAIYPEPSVTYRASDKLDYKLAGRLLGDGFKTDASPYATRVMYYEYRIGAWVGYHVSPSWKLIAGAGYEMLRVFDFYREGTKLDAGGAPFINLGLEFTP